MADRTEELRRDIAQTRDHMGSTLEQIGDRLSPGRMVERRWDRMRSSGRHLRHRVMGEARSVGQSVGDRTGAMAEQVGEVPHQMAEQVGQLPDQVRHGTQGNPLAAGAVAFGIGLVAGSLAPPARAETRLAEQVIDPLAQQAGEIGRGVADRTRDQAEQAVQQTKAAASQAASQVSEQATHAAEEVQASAQRSAEHVQQHEQAPTPDTSQTYPGA